MEDRMAKLLDDNGIRYERSKRFETVDEMGNPNFREVDFWLEEPIEVFIFCHPIRAIEVKSGHLDRRCIDQQGELHNARIYTDIVVEQYIELWELEGFLRKDPREKPKDIDKA